MLAILLAVALLAFPPLQNVEFSIRRMGYLDIAARLVLGDHSRILLFYILALWAVVCFATMHNQLPSWLLAMNTLVMIKAHIAWDKYTLPLLCVLWLLRAYGGYAH